MNQQELKEALSRAIEPAFQEPRPIVDTFMRVFTDYPIERLEAIKDEKLMDRILDRIARRKDVQEMQEWIDLEIQGGEKTLDSVVLAIVLNNLPDIGVIPEDQLRNITDQSYQEVWAYSSKDRKDPVRVAMGHFPLTTPLEDIVFTPQDVFYGEELEWIVRPGEQPTLRIDGNLILRRVARTVVFNPKINDKTSRNIVKEIIRYAVDGLYNGMKIKTRPYQGYENKLVNSLRSQFPSILNSNRSINFRELYRILELIRRGNISLDQLVEDSPFRAKLVEGIKEIIPLPYAIVRTRPKLRENVFPKVIQAIYDLQTEGYMGGKKAVRDLYGLRIILPTVEDIYRYVHQLKNTLGVKVALDERGKPIIKDYIDKPKPNGYQSYHITIEMSGIVYAVQIRTHEMDFLATIDPRQAHDSAYVQEKTRLLEQTPLAVRKVVNALLGLYKPVRKAA